MANTLPGLIIFLVWGGSCILTSAPLLALGDAPSMYRLGYIAVAPFVFIIALGTIAGMLSRFGKKGIIAGKFPRQPLHPVYFMRRILTDVGLNFFTSNPCTLPS